MPPIIIRGLDGPAVSGTKWVISEGMTDLEQTDTRKEAVQRARNKWAAPGQQIKVVGTTGKVDVVREGQKDGPGFSGVF